MKTISANVAIANCLLFAIDSKSRDIPEIDDKAAIWTTPTCIAVMCQPDIDGETAVTVGLAREVEPDAALLFDGRLHVPSRLLVLEIATGERLAEIPLDTPDARVRVWTDGHRCAAKVVVGLG